MATILDLQDRGLRYGVIVDAAATPATLAGIERAGLRYKVEVASGITAADRAALDRRGLQYFVPVSATVSMADRAILERQGLRYAVPVDADILPADLAILERQGLSYFVEVDSSGNAIATAAGGGLLLVDEANGFATDFTHAVDAERVALKTAGATTYSTVDGFYQNAGTSPKMVYDVAGVLGWSPHNLVTQSAAGRVGFEWAGNSSTRTGGQLDPEGGTQALQVITTGNPGLNVSSIVAGFIVGQPYTASMWCKGTLGQQIYFSAGGLAEYQVLVTFTGAWQRVSLSGNATATDQYIGFERYGRSAGGHLPDVTFTIWGGQFNRGTVPTAYLPTTTAARFGLALDYDPVTHAAKGLLCEPQATNLVLNSATFATQSVTVTAQTYTLSFFGTGTITNSGVSTTVLVGTGANDRVQVSFLPTAGSLTLTKSGTVTNAQLETGSVATSVIPTLGATVTRAGDVIFATGFGGSATAGSAVVSYVPRGFNAGANGIVSVNDNTANNRMDARENASGNASSIASSGGSNTAVFGAFPISLNVRNKAAFAYALNDFGFVVNGGTVVTDSSGAPPVSVTHIMVGGLDDPGYPLNGWVETVKYLPRRMSNAELVTATT